MKKSEFTKALDEVEKISEKNNLRKESEVAREMKLRKILCEQEEELSRMKIQEEKIVKSLNTRNKVMFLFMMTILGIVIIPPLYRRDPIDFWMYVIVGICFIGLIAMNKRQL